MNVLPRKYISLISLLNSAVGFLAFIFTSVSVSTVAAGPIVQTKNGLVEGSRRILNGQIYEEFLGIPYAQPPVGPLRWEKPQPIQLPWDGVRDATKYSIHCPQFISVLYQFIGLGRTDGEDCLYINVWVPQGVDVNLERPLPVMLFVYGGGYDFGTAEMYPGNGLAVHGNVVVVNFNYRVNVFGWFSTGDSAAPGNSGLWDLEAALVWIQENIAQFGGDPGRVTIFGQSAGGAQVSSAVISPKTRGLFQNAIAISGSITGYDRVDQNGPAKAVLLADAFNCSTEKTDEIVACLRAVTDPHQLLFWSIVTQYAAYGSSQFGPVVDGDILPLMPNDAFQRGYGRYVNFMNGYTFHDYTGFMIGNPIALPILGDQLNWAATNESMYARFKKILQGASNTDQLISEIVERYPGMNADDEVTRSEACARAMTDWRYGSNVNWEAIAQASIPDRQRSTYTYQFHHRFSFLVGYPAWINGSHLDDIYGSLGEPYMQTYRRLYLRQDYDDVDRDVMYNIMNYYANFAYTGAVQALPVSAIINTVTWTEFDPELQNYLHQTPTFAMEQFSAEAVDNFRFWNDFWGRVELPVNHNDNTVTTSEESDNGVPYFSKDYFYVDMGHRYRLTDTDLVRGVERLRQEMRTLFGDSDEMLVAMETAINRFAADRLRTY